MKTALFIALLAGICYLVVALPDGLGAERGKTLFTFCFVDYQTLDQCSLFTFWLVVHVTSLSPGEGALFKI